MTEDVILKEFEKLRKRIMESKLVEDATAVEIGALFEISNIINRKKAEIERLQSMNQAKLDTIHDLMAENERLKQEYDSMFSSNRNLMARVERLQKFLNMSRKVSLARRDGNLKICELNLKIIEELKTAKTEAIKEFAERVYKTLTTKENWKAFKDAWLDNGECDWLKRKLFNLVKEMTERKDEKQ